jgi:integrase
VNIAIRSEQTKRRYGIALTDLRDIVGHEPAASDLTDDNLAVMAGLLLKRELAPETINERTGRIRALWTWMAKRRLVEMFPTVQNVKEPRRIPRAWSPDQIARLFSACDRMRGFVGDIPANLFWRGLHAVLWDTGERIGALLALRWEWINLDTGRISIPAEARKGGDQDMAYSLHPDTAALLRQIQQPVRELVFQWPGAYQSIYGPYRKIIINAGLPDDRKSKFHRMRRSVASHLHAAGVDATAALGHSSAELTRRSYLDPEIIGGAAPHTVLFRPGQSPVKQSSDALAAAEWL